MPMSITWYHETIENNEPLIFFTLWKCLNSHGNYCRFEIKRYHRPCRLSWQELRLGHVWLDIETVVYRKKWYVKEFTVNDHIYTCTGILKPVLAIYCVQYQNNIVQKFQQHKHHQCRDRFLFDHIAHQWQLYMYY